jgi:putative heme degradation protein
VFRPISAAKSPIGRSWNRTFSTTLARLARRLRSHWRALLTLHAFPVLKAWRSSRNQTLAAVAGASTDQCKSLPVV